MGVTEREDPGTNGQGTGHISLRSEQIDERTGRIISLRELFLEGSNPSRTEERLKINCDSAVKPSLLGA